VLERKHHRLARRSVTAAGTSARELLGSQAASHHFEDIRDALNHGCSVCACMHMHLYYGCFFVCFFVRVIFGGLYAQDII
jgi:hypothetical protein